MNGIDKTKIKEAHESHWPTVWVWLGFLAVFFIVELCAGWTVVHGPFWLLLVLVFLTAHLMHAHILAFHETGHGTLCRFGWINDAIGLFIGTLSFQGLTAFRAVHQTHHHHLGSDRDEELWPFVVPTVPRSVRRLTAVYELLLGITYTPMLCVRTFFRADSPLRNHADRRRVIYEYLGMVVFWSIALAMVAVFHWWKFLLALYVVPGIIAGNMHSLRKYIEHMGMTGSSVLGCTRSVVPHGPIGKFIAWSLFNITYHGVHHRYAKIPQVRLPQFTSMLNPGADGEPEPYSSYWRAFRDMVRSLHDPRVGSQWLNSPVAQADPNPVIVGEPVTSV
jgi:fatty acid desaturase